MRSRRTIGSTERCSASTGVCRSIGLTAAFILLTAAYNPARSQLLSFRNYTVRQGLLSDGITTLCQDSYGYLWIGTTDGLSVYDGLSFRNYTVVDGLSSSWVDCIIEDNRKKGTMWIGTLGGGVSEFHGGRFTNFAVGDNAWTSRVNSICQGNNGTIYCATDRGVFTLVGGRSFPLSPVLSSQAFAQIACRDDSLFLLDDVGHLIVYNLSNGLVSGLKGFRAVGGGVNYFMLGRGDHLWIALSDGTIEEYFSRRIMTRATSTTANFIIESPEDKLWVGCTDGLYEIDERDFDNTFPVHLTTSNGLPDNRIWSGLIDTEGDLWLGVGAVGLCKLADQNIFEFKQALPSLSIDNSQAAADKNGHIWSIDSSGILEIWRAQSGMVMGHLHRFACFGVTHPEYSLRITDGSTLWLCDANGFVRRYGLTGEIRGPSRVVMKGKYRIARRIPAGEFLTFYVDRESRVWCSLNKLGITEADVRGDDRSNPFRLIREGLPDRSVRAIFEDHRGNIWFGGYLGGLSEFRHPFERNSTVTKYSTKDGLPDNSIRAIAEDSTGDLWIGTRFGGLAIREHGIFRNISEGDGLVSNGIWAIVRDGNGGMLLGTQLGLESVARAASDGWEFRELGNRVPVYSVGLSKSNLRWACTPAGTTVMNLVPAEVMKPPPWVHITKFLVNGESQPLVLDPAFSYTKNTVTFDFNGVSLREGKSLSYRFMLNGVDKKWRYSPGPHSVTYVSLRPGNYEFRVKAVEPSGLESANAATISFSIVPPYWQHWWFVVLLTMGAVSLIYFAARYRLGRILEIERVRSRIASDLHDEIGSGLTRIAILADSAYQSPGSDAQTSPASADSDKTANRSVEAAKKIGSNARDLIDSMSDVVWSIDPRYDSLTDFLFYFRTYANEIAEAKGIRLELSSDGIEKVRIGPQVKRTLQLISKEALSNAVKYSGCRKIRYRLSVLNKIISISLEDDGCGFDVKNVERGDGLNNMEKHAREMKGELMISSSPGNGTRLSFIFPIS